MTQSSAIRVTRTDVKQVKVLQQEAKAAKLLKFHECFLYVSEFLRYV